MQQRLVIVSPAHTQLFSAARLRDIAGIKPDKFEIALADPEPTLVVRPRLYEPRPETLTAPLGDVLRRRAGESWTRGASLPQRAREPAGGQLLRMFAGCGAVAAAGFAVEVERVRGPLPHEHDSERIYLLCRVGR